MPNHLHGILWLNYANSGKQINFASHLTNRQNPENNKFSDPSKGTQPGSVGAIIQNFKSVSTRKINKMTGSQGRKIWQRNYYEHIIRNEQSLQQIRQYILNNPLSWELDQLHPHYPKNQ